MKKNKTNYEMQTISFLFLVAAIMLLSVQTTIASDNGNWPDWRGPDDNGSITSGNYPIKWDPGNVLCDLEIMQQKGLAHLKDFKGKDTWFLRLNPVSIREVIFGLYTDKSLKSDIRKLIERQDLQHVKLCQAEESETYTLNLK